MRDEELTHDRHRDLSAAHRTKMEPSLSYHGIVHFTATFNATIIQVQVQIQVQVHSKRFIHSTSSLIELQGGHLLIKGSGKCSTPKKTTP